MFLIPGIPFVQLHTGLQSKHIPSVGVQPLAILCLLVSFSHTATSLSSTDLCMRKVCSGCIAGSLSCQEGGLSRLPDELSRDIQSVIFIGHHFQNRELSRQNFSNFQFQTRQLQRLTIRNCRIRHVQPGSFQSLPKLTQLDLSQNELTVIEANTFSGLRLDLLRLDENKGLRLAPGAFGQTYIVSLSMNYCELRSLSYEDLLPLFQTKALANLHLAGNKLFTLDSSMEPWLSGLQSFSIEQNPFLCDCNLKWMVRMLQRRTSRRTARGIFSFEDGGPQYLDDINSVPLDGDTMKPVCRAPERVNGKSIEKLSPYEFFCDPPSLQAVEIDLDISNFSGIHDGSISLRNKLEIFLRCQVKGSPDMRISWYKQDTPTDTRFSFHEYLHASLLPSKIIKPGLSEMQTSKILSEHYGGDHNAAERFMCVATDLNGNTSIDLILKWPSSPSFMSATRDGKSIVIPERITTVTMTNSEQRNKNNLVQNAQYGMSDWYFLTGDNPHGFWLQKQFSALQMIGAVVGTFTATLILFAVGCCLLKSDFFRQTCLQGKYHNRRHLSYVDSSSPNGKYSAPPSYSYAPTVHSNQSMQYNSTERNRIDTEQITSPQGIYPSRSTNLFLENSPENQVNCKRLPYVSYEPITTNSNNQNNFQSSAYSDSQTYDLPTCSVTLPVPTVPLPPLPMIGTQMGRFTRNSSMFIPVSSYSTIGMSSGENKSTPTLLGMNNNTNQLLVAMGATLNRLPSSPNTGQPLQLVGNGSLNPGNYTGAVHYCLSNPVNEIQPS